MFIHYNYIIYWPIGNVGRVFANDLGDQGSIPDRVILETQKNGSWYLLA